MNSIFVSSTFKDMQFERDAIRDISAPIINEIAKKYGEKVSFCDLRWGINTEDLDDEISERKVLSVCLDEIDRCNPPMIVILGDRYGYIPSADLVYDIAASKELQLDDYQKSVTALEIEYGALMNNPKVTNTLFYFREIDGIIPSEFADTDDEHSKKLKELKSKILSLTGGKLKTYKLSFENGNVIGVKEFAENVANDIITFMEPEWERKSKLSTVEKERAIHWSYANEKNSMFRARRSLSQKYIEQILSGQQSLVLQGDTGCGKSTLVSNVAIELHRLGYDAIPIFCGLTPRSSTSLSILRDIVWNLENAIGEKHLHEKLKTEEGVEYEDIELSDWQEQFCICCSKLSEKGKEFYFIIDALDQLSEYDSFDNLMFTDIPDCVHFLYTCISEFDTHGIPVEKMKLLDEEDIKDVIYGILDSRHRELSQAVVSAIVNKANSKNPLYINLLIDRLFLMNANDYRVIANSGYGVTAITNHQLNIINQCSDNLKGLCYEILTEGGNRINSKLVPEVLKYVATTKYGITRDALKAILKNDWSELDFAYFISYMNDFFILREDGRYDFSHKNIREEILSFTDKLEERHKEIFDYSMSYYDFISEDETMYHAVNSSEVEYIVKTISRTNAVMTEKYIFTGLNALLPIKIAKEAIGKSSKPAIYFVVENLIPRLAKENRFDMAYQIVDFCTTFFNKDNDIVNCLECLRFIVEAIRLYIVNNDKSRVESLKNILEKLKTEASNINVKEKEIANEDALQKESLEKNRRWLEEQHAAGKNKWLIFPKGVLDIRGSNYSEERGIKRFKNELISIATFLIEILNNSTDIAVLGDFTTRTELKLPPFVDFGLYKGWLLDTGESRYSFRTRMLFLRAQSRDNQKIMFIDIENY